MSAAEQLARFEAAYREHFAFSWRSLRRLGVPNATSLTLLKTCLSYCIANSTSWTGNGHSRVGSMRVRPQAQRHEQLAEQADSNEHSESVPVHDAEKEQLSERRALLEAALDAMSLEQRAVFTLFELEARTGEEVAMLLAVPAPTVHSRLRLAREIFRRTVERERAREHFELRRTGGER
jgi:RNA polymerase sigma-70 factor (ECF subfamily)